MESRIDAAHARHCSGYNCAQAVACTYADLLDMDERSLFRATEALGFGMGTMEGTCGALSGACVLAGLATSDGNLEHPATKRASYDVAAELMRRFAEKNGSITCHVLKGIGTDRGPLRSCSGCVEDACQIVEDVLFSDTSEG